MVLTVDVGNTNIVLGGFEDDKLLFVTRLCTDKYKMPDEYAISFKGVIEFHGYSVDKFDGAIISSVVPPLLPTLKKAISSLLGCKVFTVSPGTKTGLNIRIDNPGILGADLVCSAVAAMNRYKMPCIIVDLGTATKFSVLDKDKFFLGVSIMPGVNISLDALSKNTAQLPHIEFENAHTVIGTNSIDSMRSGIVFGTASMIDGMIERLNAEIGQEATVVVTGGIAENIVPHCKSKINTNPNLVLYGLLDIYYKNTKTK
ncbi:type III pantothenate kinase [Paludicola sp. MB14-C6]|uniref:type III pantothenate kinase n=1 Tax=Paludihabitans sp. MB14-C6 TaxID=3070656 RepID=UPI0027DBFFC8|nr:type III pantothenate kinase [Paludicola sp. MB14-C6]WMJ22087.1 type III pantothenate kinase [Paludicola sp. MB14-C6]